MIRFCLLSAALLLAASTGRAHFVFVVPDAKDPAKAKVVFSEDLSPDEGVDIGKVAGVKLTVRDAAGKDTPLTTSKGAGALDLAVPGKGNRVVFGTLDYGVLQRGEGKPFLLRYHPKALVGPAKETKVGDKLPAEIVLAAASGKVRFQVLANGKPTEGVEVTVLPPGDEKKKKVTTDKEGFTEPFAATGRFGVWARVSTAKAGEFGGKKYEEVRDYATLVADVEGSVTMSEFPPLPTPVTSFGAAVSDGYVYLYGGHSGKPHSYSTATTTGQFIRAKLDGTTKWEELPGGPSAQGVALVAHGGKLYRIGGMQPRNKPEEKGDSHSLTSVARFDPAAGKWEELPDLPEGRSSHDAVVVGDTIYVAGGWKMNGAGKGQDWHSTALKLDLTKQPLKWEKIEQPFKRRALTMAAYRGKIYVIAGLNPGAKSELSVNIFDPAKNAWATAADIPGGGPMNGFTPAACVLDDRLYVSPSDGKVHRLSEDGSKWEEVAALKQARVVHRVVPAGKNLLVIGGSSKGAPTGSVEVIEVTK